MYFPGLILIKHWKEIKLKMKWNFMDTNLTTSSVRKIPKIIQFPKFKKLLIFASLGYMTSCIVTPVKAETTSLLISGLSYHTHRNGQNEVNYGLGLEHHNFDQREFTPSRFGFGCYRNSYRRNSCYVVAGWRPLRLTPDLALGFDLGLVSGYTWGPSTINHLVVPMAGFTASWDPLKSMGFDLRVVPSTDPAFVLNMRYKF